MFGPTVFWRVTRLDLSFVVELFLSVDFTKDLDLLLFGLGVFFLAKSFTGSVTGLRIRNPDGSFTLEGSVTDI